MAAKRALTVPDTSAKRKVADDILKSTKTTYDSDKRPVRQDATEPEMKRAVYIIERAGRMKAAKNIYSSRWWEYERIWKMLEEERPDDEKWRANLPDTMAYAAIKTAQSAFIDSEVVPVFGKNEDDDLMKADDMRDLYTDIAKKGDQQFQLYLARMDAFKLGTGFLFVYPQKDTRVRWEIDSFDPDTDKATYTRKTVDVFNDPKTERISPYLVLVDEQTRADFRGTARDGILIEIIPREEAQLRWAHLMGGVEEFDKRIPTTQALKAISVGELQNRGIATTANNNTRDVSAHIYTFFAPIEIAINMVEVLHYFCVRPEDSHEILVNGQPVQVKTPSWPSPLPWIHKELPIVPIRYGLYSGDEFWGQGIIEVSYADAKANREYREMMNDRQRISLFSPVFSNTTDEIDQRLLKLKPLSIIRTRGGIPTQYKIPGITSADLQISADHQTSLNRATGIDPNMIGGGNSSLLGQHRLTATAIAFMRQSAYMRLKDFQFLYKAALIDEVRLKLKLFEQYYASPVARSVHEKDQEGLHEIVSTSKSYSIKVGNVYKRKTVNSTLFNGPIEHIDLDENVLMPLTPAELITKWSQVVRDMTPFVEAGIIDLDMEKMVKEYLDAMDVNMDKLRKDPDAEAISMADGEHELLIDDNTSGPYYDAILKDGTPPQFLTAAHLKRHQQLIKTMNDGAEDEVSKQSAKNLIAHIAKDTKNYKDLMTQQAQAAQQKKPGSVSGSLGDFGAPNSGGSGGGKSTPAIQMNYKDAPPDVQREIEEAAGLDPSKQPAPAQGASKPQKPMKLGKGALNGAAAVQSPDDMTPMMGSSDPGMSG